MKLLKTALLTATAAAALSGVAMAQVNPGNPASFNATATATILKPLTITQTAAMAFGTISLVNGAPGQTGKAATNGGEVNVARLPSTSAANGAFEVNGSDGDVSVDAAAGSCSGGTGAAPTLGVTVVTPSITISGAAVPVDVTGTLDFDDTASGAITCSYTVSANYL